MANVSGVGSKNRFLEEKIDEKKSAVKTEQTKAEGKASSLFSNVKGKSSAYVNITEGNKSQRNGALSDLQDQLREYGINYGFSASGGNLKYGGFGDVECTINQDSKQDLYEEMAKSYDSVLDLVVDEKLNNFMEKHGIRQWQDLYDNDNMIKMLEEEEGLKFTSVSMETDGTDYKNRQFVVSMVDENGNVIQDEDGNYAQLIKSDSILPDGYAQEVERFPSGLLESMGYDCVSMLDMTPEQYEKVKEMAAMSPSELGTATDGKGIFEAAAEWSDAKFEQHDWIYKGRSSGKGGKPYDSAAMGSTGSLDKSGLNGAGSTSDAEKAEKDGEKAPNKDVITQQEFNSKVEAYMSANRTSESIATKAISEDYAVQGSIEANKINSAKNKVGVVS